MYDDAARRPPLVRLRRLPHGEGLALPAYETALAAGCDLRAAVPEEAPLVLKPRAIALVPTGLAMAIPEGFEGQVRLGHFARQSFANDDLRVIVDLKFDDQRAMQDGIAIERGTLRVQDRAGWEAVMPVGGMVACER